MPYATSRAKPHVVTVEIVSGEYVVKATHGIRTKLEKWFGPATHIKHFEAYWYAKGVVGMLDAQGYTVLFVEPEVKWV